MPITGYYDEAQQENDRLAKQAQLNQALQAFSTFVQSNRQNKASNQINNDTNAINAFKAGLRPIPQQQFSPPVGINGQPPRFLTEEQKARNPVSGGQQFQPAATVGGNQMYADPSGAGTGVYSFNPVTGALEQVATVNKGSIVRNQMSVDDRQSAAYATGTGANRAAREGESVKTSKNLAKLVRGLDVLNKQYDEVLGDEETNALYQRFSGPAAVLGAKTGVNPNPKLLALKKNERLQAVQIVRMAGDVGAIPQQQIDETTSAISNEGLTGEERQAAVRQFLEFALANADDVGLMELQKSKSFNRIVNRYGIDIDSMLGDSGDTSSGSSQSSDPLGLRS